MFVKKLGFPGYSFQPFGGPFAVAGLAVTTSRSENIFYTSLRYYPF
jgi:hypothetical protein